MNEYVNMSYLTPLALSWIVAGWIHMVKKDSESTFDHVPLHYTFLYMLFTAFPMLVILISLIINVFQVGFISTLCYVGILVITQILNINFLYYVYRSIFGRDGFGTIIPMIVIVPLLIYMFSTQFP